MTNFAPLLLAFGFVNLAMLGWLAAAAAPLVIHLWNKRKYREVPWAAVEYLLAAMRKNSRRIRIEQWVLLLVRTLIIILLVLSVAEPFLERVGLGFATGRHTHRVLVIDGSFSMGLKPSDLSLFDRAKELASEIVEASPQGDGFTLVVLSDPPRVVIGSPAFERSDVLGEIEALRLPHSGGDVPRTLEQVEQIVLRARREHPRLSIEEVFFLTDMGRSTWVAQDIDPDQQSQFQARARRLGESAQLVIVDLGQVTSENLAVTRLGVSQPFVTLAQESTIEAQFKNFGRQNHMNQLVELYVDGRRAGEAQVDLPAGQTASASWPHRFERPGNHGVEVRLKSDLLDIDNHRWLSLAAKESLLVLCVNGKLAGERFLGATDYLAVALAPQVDASGRQAIRPQVISESALLETDLANYDCVCLSNVGQFTTAEAQVLAQYVERGGGLIVFLGDQVRPESYNRHIAGSADEAHRLFPFTVGMPSEESLYHFDPLDYSHPVVSAFQNQERAGLLTSVVYRYCRIELPRESRAAVAMRYIETGDPAVIEVPFGRGHCLMVTTSADVSWTVLPAGPAFLPLVQEMLAEAVSGQGDDFNVRVGQGVGAAVRTLSTEVPVTLTLPDGVAETLRLAADGDESLWSYADTAQSGLYAAKYGPPLTREDLFAVNVSTGESDLTPLDVNELRDDVWPGVSFVHRTEWQDLENSPSDKIARRGQLHRFLLYSVLGLLLLETTLAWQFGHHRS